MRLMLSQLRILIRESCYEWIREGDIPYPGLPDTSVEKEPHPDSEFDKDVSGEAEAESALKLAGD